MTPKLSDKLKPKLNYFKNTFYLFQPRNTESKININLEAVFDENPSENMPDEQQNLKDGHNKESLSTRKLT